MSACTLLPFLVALSTAAPKAKKPEIVVAQPAPVPAAPLYVPRPDTSKTGGRLVRYMGNDWFLNGMNLAWNAFGNDVGSHVEWGPQYDPTWFEKRFAEISASGGNVVRWWVHADGRANPSFDDKGFVTGVPPEFWEHLGDLLARAEGHGIFVIPCLWSFDMNKINPDAGRFAGTHADLLMDSLKRRSYMENFLIPFAKFVKDKRTVIAVETFNEPEWMVDYVQTDSKGQKVSQADMLRFNGEMASILHRYAEKMTTVGVSVTFNSPALPRTTPDRDLFLFRPDSLAKYNPGDSSAFFDFWSIHWYEWMNDKYWQCDMTAETAKSLKLDDRPVVWGEIPSKLKSEGGSVAWAKTAQDKGFGGAWYWSVSDENFGSFKGEALPAVKAARDAYPSSVTWNSGKSPVGLGGGVAVVQLSDFEKPPKTDGWRVDTYTGNGKIITELAVVDSQVSHGAHSLRLHFEGLSAKEVNGTWPYVGAIETWDVPPAAKDMTDFRWIKAKAKLPVSPAGGRVQMRLLLKWGKDWKYLAQDQFTDLGEGETQVVWDLKSTKGADLSSIKSLGVSFQTYNSVFTGDVFVDDITLEKDPDARSGDDSNQKGTFGATGRRARHPR